MFQDTSVEADNK